jgi:hypothetical protein
MNTPVDVLRSQVTSTQFLNYVEILSREWNEQDKLDHQLADLTYELHLARSALRGEKPVRSLEDCYQKFREPKPPKPLTRKEKQMRARMSEAAWRAAVGADRAALQRFEGVDPDEIRPKRKSKGDLPATGGDKRRKDKK